MGNLVCQLHTVETCTKHQCRKHNQNEDCHHILHHKGSKNQLRELLILNPHIIKSLNDDGCGGDAEHTAQEDGSYPVPVQHASHNGTHTEHHNHLCKHRHESGSSNLLQLLEIELKTQTKQKENHTYLAPEINALHLCNSREICKMRPCKNSGHNIAQNQRLLKFLEHYGYHTGNHKNQCQIG